MTRNILFDPFPKQQEFLDAALSGKYNFVLYGGGVRGGKSYSGLGLLILLCKIYPGSRWAVTRKDMPTIEKTIFPICDKLIPQNFVKYNRRASTKNPHYEFTNDSILLFFPENYVQDKELERFKGLEVNGFLAEEMPELQYATFIKLQERAGSYIIPIKEHRKNPIQPKPLIIGTCNPSPGWLKEVLYTPWKEGLLQNNWTFIPAIVYDNPYVSQEYIDILEGLPLYHKIIYVSGSWNFQLKKENCYWRGFELDKHVSNIPINPYLPIHESIDSNVLPYCAISLWQLDGGHAVQVDEISAEDPDNTAQKSAGLVNKYLTKIGHEEIVILHGDASAKAKNTIDNEKRSFIQLHEGILKEEFIVRNRVSNSNPSVTIRGEFINAVYEGLVPGLSISINESCKDSINDYITVVQDENGGMQKRRITKDGLTYEPFGHFSDTKAYFLCDVWKKEFNEFKNAGSTHEYILKINKSYNVM